MTTKKEVIKEAMQEFSTCGLDADWSGELSEKDLETADRMAKKAVEDLPKPDIPFLTEEEIENGCEGAVFVLALSYPHRNDFEFRGECSGLFLEDVIGNLVRQGGFTKEDVLRILEETGKNE